MPFKSHFSKWERKVVQSKNGDHLTTYLIEKKQSDKRLWERIAVCRVCCNTVAKKQNKDDFKQNRISQRKPIGGTRVRNRSSCVCFDKPKLGSLFLLQTVVKAQVKVTANMVGSDCIVSFYSTRVGVVVRRIMFGMVNRHETYNIGNMRSRLI